MNKRIPRWAKVVLIVVGSLALLYAAFTGFLIWASSGMLETRQGPPVDAKAWALVEAGMTTQQVVSLLGPPLEIMKLAGPRRSLSGVEAWHYGYYPATRLDEEPPVPCPFAHIVIFGTDKRVSSLRGPEKYTE